MENQTEKLVVSSFKFNAWRIRAALDCQIEIHNSSNGSWSSGSPSRVVGLCGQGGRHPYFELPRKALGEAVKRLCACSSLDEVAEICSWLRSHTLFSSGTGCCNDKEPVLVPLLPPEEIWCGERELPLDVWRMIAFEYDLVASAISSGLDMSPIRYGPMSFDALAFGQMMASAGRRQVDFNLNEDPPVPGNVAPLAPLANELTTSLRELFFEMGAILTPAQTSQYAKWYAAIRYIDWIASSDELRIKDFVKGDTLDTRYKALFSEELAIGLMAIVMKSRYGCATIVDTRSLLSPPGPGGLSASQINGGMIADFVGTIPLGTPEPDVIVAESKGSVGDTVSNARRAYAKKQVQAIEVSGVRNSFGLTFCSSIRYESDSARSCCSVADPAPEGELIEVPYRDDVAYRVAYAKAFSFIGLRAAAIQILAGRPATALPSIEDERHWKGESREDRRVRQADMYLRETCNAVYLSHLKNAGIALDLGVLRSLRQGINMETAGHLGSYLHYHIGPRAEEGVRREMPTGSFINTLGIGIVDYVG